MRALWSDRPNCSHNASQKVKRSRRVSDKGAAKGSCGGTVAQKGVLESLFLLCSLKVFRTFQVF